MAFTRTNLAAAIAGTLSLTMLTGCPGTNPANTGTPSGAPTAGASTPATNASPSAAASPAASTTPAASPSAAATGTGTPAPVTSSKPASGKTVVVSGTVYSEEGAKLDGVVVKVTSLDANQPYNGSQTTSQGSYVFNDVPEGVKVEVSVTKDGYTTRTQVESFQALNTNKNVLDFGGTDTGKAFFISKYPEIVMTTPAEDDTNVDNSTISVKVTLSEALDEDNKRRFEDALMLLPGDKDATADTGASSYDLEDTNNTLNGSLQNGAGATLGMALNKSNFKYTIGKSVLFLEDSATRASITWSSDNKEATLTFNAPLMASSNDPAKYNIALSYNSSDVIKDKDNNQLGTAQAASSLSTKYSTAGEIITNAFKKKDLATSSSTAFGRWDDTHDNAATFEVKEDDTAPTLQGVTISTVGNDSRYELSFNEPIAAFDGTASGYSWFKTSPTDPLGAFTFAVGKSGKLKDVDLKGGSDIKAEVITSGTTGASSTLTDRVPATTKLGASGTGAEEEFRLSSMNLWTGTRASAPTGANVVEVDSKDAKKLLIYTVGRKVSDLFDTEMVELKARVELMKDPAGNAINKATADRNVVTGRI